MNQAEVEYYWSRDRLNGASCANRQAALAKWIKERNEALRK